MEWFRLLDTRPARNFTSELPELIKYLPVRDRHALE